MRISKPYQAQLDTLLNKKRIGLVCDFDGTLSPIVSHPDQAQITPKNKKYLEFLQHHLALLAFISGRGAGDLHKRAGISNAVYVGNHGLERWEKGVIRVHPEAQPYRQAMDSTLQAIRAHHVPGMFIEDKGVTLSVHYRQTDNPALVGERLYAPMAQIAEENKIALFRGRMVFEFRPPIQADKGTAFRSLVEEYQLDGAVYLGDDTTDIAALNMARMLRKQGLCYALGGGVNSPGTPESVKLASDFLVETVSGVEELLAYWVKFIKASST